MNDSVKRDKRFLALMSSLELAMQTYCWQPAWALHHRLDKDSHQTGSADNCKENHKDKHKSHHKTAQKTQRGGYPEDKPVFAGRAHWYGKELHGHPTASGEIFDKDKLTAAHPSLPLGSYVHVKSLHTGRDVIVKVNDRCPHSSVRVIDLSEGAAKAIGIWPAAPAHVQCTLLDPQAPDFKQRLHESHAKALACIGSSRTGAKCVASKSTESQSAAESGSASEDPLPSDKQILRDISKMHMPLEHKVKTASRNDAAL